MDVRAIEAEFEQQSDVTFRNIIGWFDRVVPLRHKNPKNKDRLIVIYSECKKIIDEEEILKDMTINQFNAEIFGGEMDQQELPQR